MLPADILSRTLMCLPDIIRETQTSYVQKDRPINWAAYKVYEGPNDTIYVKRSLCDRCQKVELPNNHLVEKVIKHPKLGEVHVLSGLCRPCIQTKEYDKYLDGKALTRKDAGALWVKYLKEYEEAWSKVLQETKIIVLSEKEWLRTCGFFNGCAICGGPIEMRGKFFHSRRGGAYTPWNVIPLCEYCGTRGRFGRKKENTKKKAQVDPSALWKQYANVFGDINLFYKTKTIRLFLLNKMREYNIDISTLEPYTKRFRENKLVDTT